VKRVSPLHETVQMGVVFALFSDHGSELAGKSPTEGIVLEEPI
jgi:hypothetical protein